MIRHTAQSSLVNVKQKDLGKGKIDQNGGKCGQSGGKRDQNERSIGNHVDQRTTAGNGGQSDREIRNKDNNERENANLNIIDQLLASGPLLIVIIFFDDDFDYIYFFTLR